MTKEKVIIDDIDVSKCKHLVIDSQNNKNSFCADIFKNCRCKDIKDCYFKQLQIIKQANNQLTEENVFLNQTLKACEEEHRKLTKKYNELVNQL